MNLDIDILLREWIRDKEHSQKLLKLAKLNNLYMTHNSLIRLWRIEFDDIDALIGFDEFTETLTPSDQQVLQKRQDLVLSRTSLECLFGLKTKYYTQQKARSHSKSIMGCKYFIENHAEQISYKSFPCFTTEIKMADGVDFASLGKTLNATHELIQDFDYMEEVLSDYDYKNNSYKIIKYPDIQIWSQSGELQVVRPSPQEIL
ncbi:hypothetical protein U9J35_17295 [Rossellomorea aquimaris]|nr:hypothetical protein [Rossellomorea aquimaris]WRP05656.1 hypothetical protein U9J35_17295 [Rossellomorea aquimaris]